VNNSRMKNSRATFANLLTFAGLLLTSLVIPAACVQKTADTSAADSGSSNSSATAKGELRSTPPYSTKEPDRYRATLLTKGSLSYQSTSVDASQKPIRENSAEQRMTIARDKERRRVDYELPAGKKISLLQTPEGNYLLDPDKKLYADFADDAGTARLHGAHTDSGKAVRDFSPDELLGKGRAAARYEKLGAEMLNGRAATKYRVTPTSITGEASGNVGESLIWIDDALQMPVKQEIVSANDANNARWWMELRDIETNVPADSFEIPSGYRKVALQVLFPSNESAPHH